MHLTDFWELAFGKYHKNLKLILLIFRQYFYVRHRINLRFPHMPLVGVFGGSGHNKHFYFYPLECLCLLELPTEEESKLNEATLEQPEEQS